jgi:GNAT superfamily N-acetyltransferase
VDKDNSIECADRDMASAVRVARHDDLDGIREVQRRGGRSTSETFTQVISEAIDHSERLVVVAEADGELVGWAATKYWPAHDGAAPPGHYLMGITVAPEHRRLGVGQALIGARIQWIRHRADNVTFFVNATNTASLAAHRRWSFQEISRGNEFRGVQFDGGVGLLFHAQLN